PPEDTTTHPEPAGRGPADARPANRSRQVFSDRPAWSGTLFCNRVLHYAGARSVASPGTRPSGKATCGRPWCDRSAIFLEQALFLTRPVPFGLGFALVVAFLAL